MKCRICKDVAVLKMPRHNTALCKSHFFDYVVKQTEKAIKSHAMFEKHEKIMVCVSGGKDSLVLWKLLADMGYDVTGMYISLGIPWYSDRSKEKCEAFRDRHGLKLIIVDLAEKGIAVPTVAKARRRAECSVCGVMKRYFFNRVADEEGFDVIATGHNLDDEAARLLGNVMHWHTDYLGKQRPVLDGDGGSLKRKVKPLIRMTEQEIAAYALLTGVDYIMDECPKAKGATSITFKEAMTVIEEKMPGTKHFFYEQFVKLAPDAFPEREKPNPEDMGACSVCGVATFGDTCTFCRLIDGVEPEDPATID